MLNVHHIQAKKMKQYFIDYTGDKIQLIFSCLPKVGRTHVVDRPEIV